MARSTAGSSGNQQAVNYAEPSVLDASAVLALLRAEPGSDKVAVALPQAVISSVNAAEVFCKVSDWGMAPAELTQLLNLLRPKIVPFDVDLAVSSARLRGLTKSAGLSLGDRACLALAHQLRIPVLTSDAAWSGLPLGLAIRQLR